MSWNGLVQSYTLNVAFWLLTLLAIMRFAIPFPWQVWVPVMIEESFGEPVVNRILLSGVVVALLFAADKYGGPFSWPVWMAALALWFAIAAATTRFGKKKAAVARPRQPVGF
jgi:hypothetical protein